MSVNNTLFDYSHEMMQIQTLLQTVHHNILAGHLEENGVLLDQVIYHTRALHAWNTNEILKREDNGHCGH